MRLIVIRHGESVYNDQRRFTGQADVPLTPLGKRQAAALGKRLAGEHLDAIVSSDLQRARDTAEAIAAYHALIVRQDSDLRELAFGEWEGFTYAEIQASDPDRLAKWRADPTTFTPPGGESVASLRDRIVRALERWQSQYPAGSVVWVTHGGLIGVLLCYVLGLDLNRRWQFRHDNASISELELRRDWVIIVRLNDTAHVPRKDDQSDTAD